MAKSDDDTGYIGPLGPQEICISPQGPEKRRVKIVMTPEMIKNRIGRFGVRGLKKRYVKISLTPEMTESRLGRFDARGVKKIKKRKGMIIRRGLLKS